MFRLSQQLPAQQQVPIRVPARRSCCVSTRVCIETAATAASQTALMQVNFGVILENKYLPH